jgi:hypothetical protein
MFISFLPPLEAIIPVTSSVVWHIADRIPSVLYSSTTLGLYPTRQARRGWKFGLCIVEMSRRCTLTLANILSCSKSRAARTSSRGLASRGNREPSAQCDRWLA